MLTTGLALLVVAGSANAQDNCKPIKFPRGTTSTVVHGLTEPSDSSAVACYIFAAAAGQTANLSVSKNMAMSIIDVGDDQPEWIFKTKAKTYQVNVFEDGRSATRDPFTLTISIH